MGRRHERRLPATLTRDRAAGLPVYQRGGYFFAASGGISTRYGQGSETRIFPLAFLSTWIFMSGVLFSLGLEIEPDYFFTASGGISTRYGHGSETLTLPLAFLST